MKSSQTRSIVMMAIALGGALLAIGLIAWSLLRPVGHNNLRLLSSVLLLAASMIASAHQLARIKQSRAEEGIGGPAEPGEPSQALPELSSQEEKARLAIERLSGEQAREALRRSFDELKKEKERAGFRVVVFGTGSAGKTSLINALLGRDVGATDPIMGTTRHGEVHTEVIEGVEGTLLLTDTPGLSEFGEAGEAREREAKELAEAADLILFVLDHDLIRTEIETLLALASLKKRLIVVFNKIDRFTPEDRSAVLAKLRERLKGRVAAQDVLAVAAAPRPVPVRVVMPNGSSEIHYEPEDPDVAELEARISQVLEQEGPSLRAMNLLLRTRRLERKAAEALARERRAKALAVIEKYQWITAASVFASPVAAINLATGGTAQYQMVTELSQIYGVEPSTSRTRALVAQMMAALLKLGLGEAATTLIAGLFKTSFIGFAAAGAVQAVTMAYLIRVSGLAFAEYFAREQTWGDGGIHRALLRQFDATSRTEFLQEFVKQAAQKLADRAGLLGSAVSDQSCDTDRGVVASGGREPPVAP